MRPPEDVRTVGGGGDLAVRDGRRPAHGDQAGGAPSWPTRVLELLDTDVPRAAFPPAGNSGRSRPVNLGGAQMWAGDFAEAEQQLTASAPEALELGLPLVNLNAIGHLALLDALQGRCRRAATERPRSLRIIERRGLGLGAAGARRRSSRWHWWSCPAASDDSGRVCRPWTFLQ